MIKRAKNNPLIWNSFILFFGTMAASVLNYFFHLAIGRMVSVEVYGEIESLNSLICIIFVPVATLTMVAARYSSAFKAENNPGGSRALIKYLDKKILKYGLPLFLLALVATPYFRDFLKIESGTPVVLLWILMLISFFSSVNMGILQGWQNFMGTNWVGMWGAAAKLIFGILLVKIGFGLNGAIGSYVVGAVISYFVSVFFLKFIILGKKEKEGAADKFDPAAYSPEQDGASLSNGINFSGVKNYVLPVFFGSLAINILGNADMVLAKHNLDPAVAGQYGALTIVSKIIFFATSVVGTVLFSMSAEADHKNENTRKILMKALYLLLFISFCAIAVYFIAPELILKMLFGNKYAGVAGYLGWFAVMVAIYSVLNLLFQYFLSINETKISKKLLIISIVAALVVLFAGKSISAILIIMVASQIVALVFCWAHLAKYSSKT